MRLLFVPVSAPRGMGEYARSREIARAISLRWPMAQIQFILSRAAPYATECPFPVTLLPSSPTFHSREVGELIASYRPHVVIFDNAGRSAQLRAAVLANAKVIYVSSRRRQRHKAFRFRWMRLLTEHWIAYPEFIAGSLTLVERAKLGLIGGPTIRYIDTVIPQADASGRAALLARLGLQPGTYTLIVAGGGTPHTGAENAPRIFADTAVQLANKGHRVVLVGADPSLKNVPGIVATHRLPTVDLVGLMLDARLVVTNGGDTLLQALACKCACVASPVAHDQAERIDRCAAAGLVLAASLDTEQMMGAACRVLEGSAQLPKSSTHNDHYSIRNALDTAVDAIGALVPHN